MPYTQKEKEEMEAKDLAFRRQLLDQVDRPDLENKEAIKAFAKIAERHVRSRLQPISSTPIPGPRETKHMSKPKVKVAPKTIAKPVKPAAKAKK